MSDELRGVDLTRDHEVCCSCVQRLREQNHKSAREWTERTADVCSDLDGLRHLMHEARALHRIGDHGLSTYGQAALAAALQVADEAEGKLEAMTEQMMKERRRRIAAESRLNGPLRPRPMPAAKPTLEDES